MGPNIPGSGNHLQDRLEREMDAQYNDVPQRCSDCECWPCVCGEDE